MKMKRSVTLKQVSSFLSSEEMKQIKKVQASNEKILFANHIKQATGFKPVSEFRFTKERRWRLDYAIPELKIAIEVEGGRFKKTTYYDKKAGKFRTHIGGRHNTATGFKNDMEKYNELAALGWLLVRTTPEELFSAQTLNIVQRCIKNRLYLSKMIP